MIAVIFEVVPKPGCDTEYLGIAADLKPEVEKIDGFLSMERFESVVQPGKFVSLSFWRDEAAIKEWRERRSHRSAQEKGKAELFASYRLRVAHIVDDYGVAETSTNGARNPG